MHMKIYKKRVVDEILQLNLESHGAVLIEGAKWCGKTTTASQFAKSILLFQDPETVESNLELARIKPSKLLEGEVPHLIDEWQMAPKLWDAVRFEVDKRDAFGQFILTGSATPPNLSEIHHSGVGRFTKMLMRPMSLYESGESTGEVSLKALFDGEEVDGSSKLDIDALAFLVCRGGWPKSLECSERVALRQAIGYHRLIVTSDISRADGVNRSPARATALMRSYARNIAAQTPTESIVQDINAGDSMSYDTVASYIDALRKIFVIEEAPAWCPNLRSRTAIRTAPTRYYVDPSLAAASLGIGPNDLLNDLNTMGLLFENLCFRDLRIYAELLEGEVYHYRDKNGLECDAVVHLRNGSYGLIEIKLGGAKRIDEGAATLRKLADNLDTTRIKPPAFLAVLTGTGSYAYRREDGILVIPIGTLKP